MKFATCFILLIVFCNYSLSLQAKKLKAMRSGEQVLLLQHKPETKKPKSQIKVEEILSKHLDGEFSLATVEDIFPYELDERRQKKLTRKSQAQLRDYYNYVRRDLEHLSGGQFLKYINKDLDLDGRRDYAVVAINRKNKKKSFVIVNEDKVLYQEDFDKTYFELVNEGKYPLKLDTGKNLKQVNSTCLRLRPFDGEQDFIFFDRYKKDWVRISFDVD